LNKRGVGVEEGGIKRKGIKSRGGGHKLKKAKGTEESLKG